MSGYRVIYVLDGVVSRWWQVDDIDTNGLRESFDGLPDSAVGFETRVSSQDGIVLPDAERHLWIEPGPAFRLIGPDEYTPPLGSRVD
jgi:hypothetical protein